MYYMKNKIHDRMDLTDRVSITEGTWTMILNQCRKQEHEAEIKSTFQSILDDPLNTFSPITWPEDIIKYYHGVMYNE